MAGGRATRFGRGIEKAILEVGGTTLLERAVGALAVDDVGEVFVATSPSTPRTEELARRLGAKVVRTGGRGYHEDVMEILESHPRFLSLNVDIPFVTPEHVSRMVGAYRDTSLAAVVPKAIALRTPGKGTLGDADGDEYVWVGLNIVTPDPETELLEFLDPLLSVNVNDDGDLRFAEGIATGRRA